MVELFRPTAGEITEIVRGFGRIAFWQKFIRKDGTVDNFGPLFAAESAPAIVFPLTDNEKVVAIKQFRHGADEFVIEFPGGNPKQSQGMVDCALEELREETGYSPQDIIPLTLNDNGVWLDPASLRIKYFPYLASGCAKVEELKPSRTEIIETVEVGWPEFFEMIRNGEINDSKTLAIITLALLNLGVV